MEITVEIKEAETSSNKMEGKPITVISGCSHFFLSKIINVHSKSKPNKKQQLQATKISFRVKPSLHKQCSNIYLDKQ